MPAKTLFRARARTRAKDRPITRPAAPGPLRPLARAAAVLLVLLLCILSGWLYSSGRFAGTPDAGPPPVVLAAPGGLGSPVRDVKPATAVAVLETLDVKGRAPRNNYDRSAFGEAWLDADNNGCDTRNDVLRRDMTYIKLEAGSVCVVATGVLADPYTGHSINFTRGAKTSADVQIDHMVALGNAWQTGAQQLSPVQRQSLANDPLNLLAVDGPTNVQKSDADAATWLPPAKKFRCSYVARQIAVKASYGLWVTPAEKAAMLNILRSCPGQMTAESGYLK